MTARGFRKAGDWRLGKTLNLAWSLGLGKRLVFTIYYLGKKLLITRENELRKRLGLGKRVQNWKMAAVLEILIGG